VYARSLDSGDNILLAEQQGFVAETGGITMPVRLENLMPGSYRLVSNVDMHADGRIKHLEASRLVHLVA